MKGTRVSRQDRNLLVSVRLVSNEAAWRLSSKRGEQNVLQELSHFKHSLGNKVKNKHIMSQQREQGRPWWTIKRHRKICSIF